MKEIALAQLVLGDEQGALETITIIPNDPESFLYLSSSRDALLSEMLESIIGPENERDATPVEPMDPEQVKKHMQIAEQIAEQIQGSYFKAKAWLALANASEVWEQRDAASGPPRGL